jgi:hypothetical protein
LLQEETKQKQLLPMPAAGLGIQVNSEVRVAAA